MTYLKTDFKEIIKGKGENDIFEGKNVGICLKTNNCDRE